MNKGLHYTMTWCFGLGWLILFLSNIFRHSLTDFIVGFCEGLSIVFIVGGLVYWCWYLIKRKKL